MSIENTSKRVQELFDNISKAQDELAQIRSACAHPTYYIGRWSWRVGAFELARICSICCASIPGITDEERNQFPDEFAQSTTGIYMTLTGCDNSNKGE